MLLTSFTVDGLKISIRCFFIFCTLSFSPLLKWVNIHIIQRLFMGILTLVLSRIWEFSKGA